MEEQRKSGGQKFLRHQGEHNPIESQKEQLYILEAARKRAKRKKESRHPVGGKGL